MFTTVNPSALQESSKHKRMTVTSGRIGIGLSASISLQRSLQSKLQERLPLDGWIKSRMTWKQKVTPSGRSYSQLAVSVRPTKETDCGLWATPNTMDNLPARTKESLEAMHDRARKGRNAPSNLREQVIPHIWPTPTARDWKDTGNLDTSMQRKDGKMRHDTLPRVAWLGSNAQTENKGQLNPAFVCWLMGYPADYEKLLYKAMETPSCHK